MKAILLIFVATLIGFSSKAYLKVFNNTCVTFTFGVGCHDNNYSDCGAIQSQSYTLAPGETKTFANTSFLAPTSGYDYTTFTSFFNYTPQNTQNWDYAEFVYYVGTHPGTIRVGSCLSMSTSTTFQYSNPCSSDFLLTWGILGTNTLCTISDI